LLKQTRNACVNYDKSQFNLHSYSTFEFRKVCHICLKSKILIVAATFKEAINILGGLDILINNAGVINETDFAKAIDVNVVSFIFNLLFQLQVIML